MKKIVNNIEIFQSKGGDEELISSSWKIAYPNTFKYKFPEKWEWVFYNNPFSNTKNGSIPLWVAIESNQVVGWVTAINNIIEVNNKSYFAGEGADLYVLSNNRGKGIATNLVSSQVDYYDVFLVIKMAPTSRKITHNLGSIKGKPFLIYFKLIKKLYVEKLYESFSHSVKKRFGVHIAQSNSDFKKVGMFNLVSDFFSILLKKKQKSHKNKKFKHNPLLSYKQIQTFDNEADELWTRCKSNYSLSVKRDSRYLNWKYVKQPHLTYQKYYILQNNQLYGILVHRIGKPPEMPVGIITDLFTEDNNIENLSCILNFSEKQLISQGAEMICCGASTSSLKYYLEHSSFLHIETYQPSIYLSDDLNIDKKKLIQGEWLMSIGDQDIDVPLKNWQPVFSHIIPILLGKISGN